MGGVCLPTCIYGLISITLDMDWWGFHTSYLCKSPKSIIYCSKPELDSVRWAE